MKPTLEQLKEQLNSLTEQIKKYESGERFELNRWYINKFKELGFALDESYGYGFESNMSGWRDKANYGFKFKVDCYDWRLATHSEVEAALIAEAKKRGFKEGVRFNSARNGSEQRYESIKWEYGHNYNDCLCMSSCGNGTVYYNGQWATIIPQEEKIEIGGYKLTFETVTTTEGKREDGTKIDGHYFSKLFWESAKAVSLNNKAKIMVGCSKQFDVSLDTINAILKKL